METTILLTAEEVAERLRVNVNTVRRYIRSGRLPAIRLGKGYRIRSEDLESFLRSLMTNGNLEVENEDEDEEPLSPEDLAAVRRGMEGIKAGRYVTLEELDAWREAGAESAVRRLEEVEAEILPEELKEYLAEIAKRAKPVRWDASRCEFEEVNS